MFDQALPASSSTRRVGRLALAMSAALGCNSGDNHVSSLEVHTDHGAVVGMQASGVHAFLGIPYAAAPVGALRWKAPTEVSWTDARPAQQYGPPCYGVSLLDSRTVRTGASEDCLSLNIWSPPDAAGRPVLFWIHGGGFIDGSGRDYPGDVLASTGDVVVVTINYRLGALGTLAIPSADGGGNLALLDQQFALQWVRRNIAEFGGDPAQVTVAGESAGASAACLHAAMPSSQTLLSALLMESGSCDGVQVPAQAAATADALATQWGCAAADGTLDEGCLRALPAETVVRGNTLTQVAPILDGTLVPTSPRAALAAGSFAKVPILAGYNANEGLFFTDGVYAAAGLTDLSNYPALLDLAYGPLGPTLLALYPLADYGNDPRTAFASIIRDSLFECPTRHLFSASQAPVFAYDFSYAPSLSSPQPVLAMHTVELPYVWGIPLPWTWWDQANAGVPGTPRELELAAQIRTAWTTFVTTHAPTQSGSSAPPWPAFSASSQSTMMFGASTSAAALPSNANCALWDQLYGGL